MNLKDIVSQIDIWEDWLAEYKRNVPNFIAEATKGLDYKQWDKTIFDEFFNNATAPSVTSLKQGYFTNGEKDNIKNHWSELSPLLKSLADNQDSPQWDTYNEIKSIIRKYTNVDRRVATNRLIVSLQPKLLCTIVKDNDLNRFIILLNKFNLPNVPDYIGGNWFKNSYNIFQYFQKGLPNIHYMDLATYPWQILVYLDSKKINNMEDINNKLVALLEKKHQIILQGAPGTGKTYTAKKLAEKMVEQDNSSVQNDSDNLSSNIKLIQFHPSFSYEDFVRGIVVDLADGGIPQYNEKNKILGEFAAEALKNKIDSEKSVADISKEEAYKNALESYKEYVSDQLTQKGEVEILGTTAYVVSVEDDSFRYMFKNRPNIFYNLLYKDLLKSIMSSNEIVTSTDLEKIGLKMKGKHPYYFHVMKDFENFIRRNNISLNATKDKVGLHNYVLIIDEINRANLPSVLGELIYALEYRNEPVDSMYAIDGNYSFILPDNLYIIGTMNTADRSVGQIDYAIRRRFAFVEILPKDLSNSTKDFDLELFKKVSALFVKNVDEYLENNETLIKPSDYLSKEFRPEDVWIGHSYFIMDKMDKATRLQYEIIPILKEYIKDGILNDSAYEYIHDL